MEGKKLIRLFLLFNHTITHLQEGDARASLGVEEIISAPAEIQHLWSRVPPDLAGLSGFLEPVCQWLREAAVQDDYILVQGDFGATFLLVEFALENGLIPIYSTTARTVVEKHLDDGGVKLEHNFRHVCFRRYGR